MQHTSVDDVPGPASAAQDDGSTEVRVSSFCTGGTCVGVKIDDTEIVVVDTKGGGQLRFDADEWDAFLAGAKNGEFDRPATRAR